MAQLTPRPTTFEEFVQWERRQETRHEFVDGDALAMAGGTAETQREDRTLKLADYNASPSIAHYVLIEQDEPRAYVYGRGPHGDFNLRPREIKGMESVVELPAIGITLAMAEIYDGLAFGSTQPERRTPGDQS